MLILPIAVWTACFIPVRLIVPSLVVMNMDNSYASVMVLPITHNGYPVRATSEATVPLSAMLFKTTLTSPSARSITGTTTRVSLSIAFV
jgi:hypothetical protein